MKLPPGEDLCEWLAVNTVDFYNAASVLYGLLEEFCTPTSCPYMTAGAKVQPAHGHNSIFLLLLMQYAYHQHHTMYEVILFVFTKLLV